MISNGPWTKPSMAFVHSADRWESHSFPGSAAAAASGGRLYPRAARIRRARSTTVAVAGILLVTCLVHAVSAQQPPAPAVDFEKLSQLLRAGDYAAVETEATTIEAAVKPKSPKDPDYLPRCKASLDALVARGLAALRTGRLEAADEALTAADALYSDKDFQKTFAAAARAAGPQAAPFVLALDLIRLEMLDLMTSLRLLALRDAEPGAADPLVERVTALLEESAKVRGRVAPRIAKADELVQKSPHYQVLGSRAENLKFGALLACEQSRLAGAGAGERITAALAELDEARALTEQAIAAALGPPPEGKQPTPPEPGATLSDAEREACLERADVLEATAEAALTANDAGRARGAIEAALAWRRAALPKHHPDLLAPTVVSALASIAQATAPTGGAAGTGERPEIAAASAALGEARQILLAADRQFDAASPVRKRLELATAALSKAEAQIDAQITITDAADAAAARAIATLESDATAERPPAADRP
jgi:hypothetical protein